MSKDIAIGRNIGGGRLSSALVWRHKEKLSSA